MRVGWSPTSTRPAQRARADRRETARSRRGARSPRPRPPGRPVRGRGHGWRRRRGSRPRGRRRRGHGPRATPSSSRSRPTSSRGAVAQMLVEPGVRLLFIVWQPASTNPTCTTRRPCRGREVGEAVDEPGRRKPVHHVELGVLAHDCSDTGSSPRRASISARRSPSGGARRPRSTASILANVRRRLYQSSRLPSRPGFGDHPERLVGVEVVGVAVDPEQLAGARACAAAAADTGRAARAGTRRRGRGARCRRRAPTGHGSSTSPLGHRNGVAGSAGSPNSGLRAAARSTSR